jgi:hypothetical protein
VCQAYAAWPICCLAACAPHADPRPGGRVAREVQLEGERITFVFPAKELTMPAADVLEIRRACWDMHHLLWLRFHTKSHGTIKVAARLRGLFDLLSEFRRLNPSVTYPDF